MTNKQVKEDMIKALYNRGEYIRQVSDVEYQTRCPFCGDSVSNLRTGHLYIRIGLQDNFPMVYNCFKCDSHGIVDQNFISVMEIDDLGLKSSITGLNKTSDKLSSHKFINGEKEIIFSYERPEVKRGKKTEYLENRLGVKLSDEDLVKMKVITSLREFLILNEIKKLTCSNQVAYTLEDHYIGFLSYGGSHILLRDITGKEDYKWIKYPITEESKQCKLFYSMETELDIFTEEPIIINLAEGVLDITSAYSNLGYKNSNTLNIAVGGKNYHTIITKLVNMGLVGDNITVNIFADNDLMYNKKYKEKMMSKDKLKKESMETQLDYFRKSFHTAKYLFKEVNVYFNMIGKDIGVPRDEISLQKFKL